METETKIIPPDMDWYVLTELANDILQEVMAYSAREELKEKAKQKPDLKRISRIRNLLHAVLEINKDPENFQSLNKVNSIIRKYNAVLDSEI